MKYKYKVIQFSVAFPGNGVSTMDIPELNSLGEDGWEVIHVTDSPDHRNYQRAFLKKANKGDWEKAAR